MKILSTHHHGISRFRSLIDYLFLRQLPTHWKVVSFFLVHKKFLISFCITLPRVCSFSLRALCFSLIYLLCLFSPHRQINNFFYFLCLLFRSATGKSTILKNLVQTFPRSSNLYLVNVKGDETAFYEKHHKKTWKISFHGIKNAKKNSVIIVEDVINMKKDEEIDLRKAINYTVHHNKCKLFCVSHTITKTGIYSMMSLFNYIIFTGSPSNLPVMRTCLRYFKIENETVAKWLNFVKKLGKKNTSNWDPYYFFDCTKMIFCATTNLNTMSNLNVIGSMHDVEEDDSDDDDDDDDEYLASASTHRFLASTAGSMKEATLQSTKARKAKVHPFSTASKHQSFPFPLKGGAQRSSSSSLALTKRQNLAQALTSKKKVKENRRHRIDLIKKNFAAFFQGHELQSQASAIFAIVADKFGEERIDPIDLSIVFARTKNRGRKKISTVDYIASLLNPDKAPPLDHIVLHNFITKHCIIPISCIRNPHFLSGKHGTR